MTASIDWNWFFSSLAQSSAAVVGVFGAFIITKILSNQSVFAEKTSRMRSMLTEAHRLQESACNLAFPWYIRLTVQHNLERAEEILEDAPSTSAESLFERLNFPPFVAHAEIIHSLEALRERLAKEKEDERQRYEKELASRARTFPGGFAAMPTRNSLKVSKGLNHPHAQLQNERDSIDNLRVEIRHHIRSTSDLLGTVAGNPEASRAISATLLMVAVLFLIGVIYPLSFMPVSTSWKPELDLASLLYRIGSLRGALLTAVSLIFLAALGMFWQMNRRLIYDTASVGELRAFTSIETYSKYYDIAEKNSIYAQDRERATNKTSPPKAE